jgi:hypothetical protein
MNGKLLTQEKAAVRMKRRKNSMKAINNGADAPEQTVADQISDVANNNETVNHIRRVLNEDPFDPAQWRADTTQVNAPAAKKLLLKIPVTKPKKFEFIRVHPTTCYPANLIEYEGEQRKDVYLVHPDLVPYLQKYCCVALLYLAINRTGDLFFWLIKQNAGGPGADWSESAEEAAEIAKSQWVNIVANKGISGYDVSPAIKAFSEPEWPELSLKELLDKAFKAGNRINDLDHPLLQKLDGRID